MPENVVLKEARNTVEAKLCDAFNEMLLKGLPDDLRDLGRRLEQAGAKRVDLPTWKPARRTE